MASDISFIIQAVDKFSPIAKKINAAMNKVTQATKRSTVAFKKMSKAMDKVGKTAGRVGREMRNKLTLPIVAGVGVNLKVCGDFEAGITK